MKNPERQSTTEQQSPLHRVIEMSENELKNAISRDFGLTITQLERVAKGYSSEVYRAIIDDEACFIRINRDSHVYPVEIKGYEILRDLGIPVPKVIAFKPQPDTIKHPTIILSAAEGIELNPRMLSSETERAIYTEMGAMLAQINTVTVQGFGQLYVEDERLKGRYDTWREYQDALGVKIENSLTSIEPYQVLSEDDVKLIREVHHEIKALGLLESHLLHRDIHSGHVFIQEDKISGIIDLGGLEAGDPRYDIATSLVFQTPLQQAAFKEGYGGLAGDPLVIKYQLLVAVRKLAFRMKHNNQNTIQKTIEIIKETIAKVRSDL